MIVYLNLTVIAAIWIIWSIVMLKRCGYLEGNYCSEWNRKVKQLLSCNNIKELNKHTIIFYDESINNFYELDLKARLKRINNIDTQYYIGNIQPRCSLLTVLRFKIATRKARKKFLSETMNILFK